MWSISHGWFHSLRLSRRGHGPPHGAARWPNSTWLGSSEPEVQAEPEEADACIIQQQQERLALNALKAEVDVAGQPVHRRR